MVNTRSWALLGALSILTACGSTSGNAIDADGIDWIENAGAISEYLAAAGSAPIANDLSIGVARDAAARNARTQLAATLETQVEQFAEDYTKEAGDLTDPASLSSLVNNAVFTRQSIDLGLKMARVVRYEQRDDIMYALAVLDDPAKWVENVGSSMADELLKDETLIKTEVMKEDMRKRAEAFFDKQAEAKRKLREDWSPK